MALHEKIKKTIDNFSRGDNIFRYIIPKNIIYIMTSNNYRRITIMLKRLTLIFICLLILLTSCITTPECTYVSAEITYSERGGLYSFRARMDSTETELAKYYFEPSIKNEDREACIEATDKVLSSHPLNLTPEIYIFSQSRYGYKYISDHKLYCSIQDWESVDYIIDVLLVAYGR